MGGEGSIQSMITILRNNKKLLRKRNPFRRGTGFERLRSDYRKYAEGKIESKPISKKELKEIREKILKQKRKENFWSVIGLLFLFIIAIGFTVKIYNNLQEYQTETNGIITEEQTKKYLFYIEDGDKWLEKAHFNNAIFQYLLAKEIYPSEYNINYRLALAFGNKCKYEQSGCMEGKRVWENLTGQFPEKSELDELGEYFD